MVPGKKQVRALPEHNLLTDNNWGYECVGTAGQHHRYIHKYINQIHDGKRRVQPSGHALPLNEM